MKLKIAVLAFVFLLATQVMAAERKPFGVGVIAGQPTGITFKLMLNDIHGIDFGGGWRTSGDNEYHIYGDYLYHLNNLVTVSKGELPFYVGLGARYLIRDDRDDKFGLRLPVGVEYLFENVPLGAFAEVVPVLNLSPDTDFDLEGGIGIRFFF
jgi:hypothetical protein